MLNVRIDLVEMMIVFKGFKTVHVVCLWIYVLITNFEKTYQFGWIWERKYLLTYGSFEEKRISSLLWVSWEELGFWNPICLPIQLFSWMILVERAWVHEVNVHL
jgi:hypothetical protein